MSEIPDEFQPDFLGFSFGFFQHAAAVKRQETASRQLLPNTWTHHSSASISSSGQAKPYPAPDAYLRSRKPPLRPSGPE